MVQILDELDIQVGWNEKVRTEQDHVAVREA